MPIPFKTLKPAESVEVAGISMQKRGCLTVAEEIAVRELESLLSNDFQAVSAALQDIDLKQRIVTILIQSRIDKEWTLEKTKAPEWDGVDGKVTPDMVMLDELFNFFMAEQRRWKSSEEVEEAVEESQGKRSTGRKSTGGSDSSTQTKSSSQQKTLATAP